MDDALKINRKEIKAEAKGLLARRGVLPKLIFAVFCTALVYITVELAEALLYFSVTAGYPALAESAAFEWAVTLGFDIIGMLALAPILGGAFRLAARAEESVRATEIFYYYAPKKYLRALAVYTVTALPVMLLRTAGDYVRSLLAARADAIDDAMHRALLLLYYNIILTFLMIAAAAILLLLYCKIFSLWAAVICGEGQPLRMCFSAALGATKGRLKAIYVFFLSFLPWIALSLLTVGMLFVVFTIPYMLISYFYYNAALFGKEPRAVALSTEVTFDER